MAKIVHLTSVHRPFDVRIFEKECKSLAQAGHQVVLIARHERDEVIDGVQLRAVPLPSSRWQRMARTTWQVYRLARREQADLYHLHDPELLPWARRLRRHAAVVYDMHENVPKDILSKSWIPRPARRLVSGGVRQLERRLLRALPVVFAEDSYVADYPWIECFETVRNMPRRDALRGIPAGTAAEPTVGYIGAVSADRGSMVTLKALRHLKARGLSVGFECVGPVWPAEHLEELRQYVNEHQLERVHFHGYVPAAQGWPRMARSHVGLAVLRDDPNFVDSYPTKMFEYMALGLPVVVSDFPLYRQVVQQTQCGRCVDPHDPVQLADAIEFLIKNPVAAADQGRRGQRAVEETYNWESEFGKLQGLYERVLNRPSHPAAPSPPS